MDDRAPVPGPAARRTLLRRYAVERTVLGLVLLVLTLMVPVAAAVGSAVHAEHAAMSEEQRRTRHQSTATLLDATPADPDGPGGGSVTGTVKALAEWRTPAGDRRTGTVPAPRGRAAGSTVPVWLDTTGAVVPAPLTAAGAVVVGVLYAALWWLVTALAGGGVYGAVRLWRARRRELEWARAWAEVEPHWSRRVR